MGDMADDCRVWREQGKIKRENNRANGADLLRMHGLDFEHKNDGAHLIIRNNGQIIDYWPGTGKWVVRGTNKYKRGIFGLLRHLGIIEN